MQFGKPVSTKTTLSQKEIAELWISRGGDPNKADLASAVAMAESAGNTKSVSNPCCKGLWQINVEVGNSSLSQALDANWATDWTISATGSKNGTDWSPWEAYTNGAYKQYLGKSGVGGGSNPSLGEEVPIIGGAIGDVEGAIGGIVGGAGETVDFLGELVSTLTNFRKLGQLAAEASAWFLKLIAKAIWDYVIAPLLHWTERAVSFYWVNFFGAGTEQGSGFGYTLRNNAGTITILFWSLGYAILWSNGESASMVTPHDSLLGQGIKGVEGAIARRHLVKPKDVKAKTPDKPKEKVSTVPIEPQGTFSVSRKRPVSVTGQHMEGRQHGHSQRRFSPAPIQRPGRKKLAIAKGYTRRAQTPPPKKSAKPRKSRVGT